MNTLNKTAFLLAISSALLTVERANATILYPNGTTSGTLSGLQADGWTVLYDQSYGTPTTSGLISSWATAAGNKEVFVGAVDANGNIILGATGKGNEVFAQTASTSSASPISSSSLYWYNVPYSSFGFTPTRNIDLFEADVTGISPWSTDDGQNSLRLSWHLDIGVGGWRAGDQTWLNYSDTPNKLILVESGVSAVPEPSTYIAGALMLVPFAASGLRSLRNRKQS